MSRTVGVEEELLLFRRADAALAALGDELADPEDEPTLPSVEHEFKLQQIETATRPLASMADLERDIAAGRRTIARRAGRFGVAPVAVATDPAAATPVPTQDERYAEMQRRYGEVAAGQLTCGMHVHVAIDSRREGIEVLNRLRPWLPVLLAMSANSPFHQGVDTAYASYRYVRWGLWPTAGPSDTYASPEHYDAAVSELIASGAALDAGMIYFDARLSASYPTVEIRIMDVTPTPADAVLLAALSRALVDTASSDWRDGRSRPDPSRSLLRAASWRAARFGLSDQLVDPRTRALRPAADVVSGLVKHVRPALLGNGDLELVERGVERLVEDGTGADRQRRAFARSGEVEDVIGAAIAWTVPRPPA